MNSQHECNRSRFFMFSSVNRLSPTAKVFIDKNTKVICQVRL
jgi:hypothetical protein